MSEDSRPPDKRERSKQSKSKRSTSEVRRQGDGPSSHDPGDDDLLRLPDEDGGVGAADGGGAGSSLQRRVFAYLEEHGAGTAVDIASPLGAGVFFIEEALEGLRRLGLVSCDHPPGSEGPVDVLATYALSEQGRARHSLTDDPKLGYSDAVEMEKGERDASASATGIVELQGTRQASDATVLDLLDEGLAAASGAAWKAITGSAHPTPEDIQAWLDRVNEELHRDGAQGHFGSFSANSQFASKLRLLLQGLGAFRLRDEKTGLPGMLYHRRGKRCPTGRFVIKVHTAEGKTEDGTESVRVPRLRLFRQAP